MTAHLRLPDQTTSSLFLAPSRTVVTSFQPKSHTFEDGDWVLCLATSRVGGRSLSSISVAVSNGEIQVYDPERLQRVSTYSTTREEPSNASSCVTDLQYHHSGASLDTSSHSMSSTEKVDASGPTLLWATNQSGSVQLYDLRQQAIAASAQVPFSSPAWTASIGHGGTVAAVAGNRKIHFLDVRAFTTTTTMTTQLPSAQMPWIGCYRDAHSDHVASVRYVSDSTLLSGGEDGVVAVFDTSQPNESDALQHMWNVGSPVRKVGIMTDSAKAAFPEPTSSSLTTVWCLTGNETLSLWQPDMDVVHDFSDLRTTLTAASCQHAPSQAGSVVAPPAVEYLIDAHWDPQSGLLLAAGNAQGDAAVFRLGRSFEDPSSASHTWTPIHVLAGGHRGVVRGLQHYSDSVLFSVGEDARLCEWNRQTNGSLTTGIRNPSAVTAAAAVGGGPVRRQRGRPNLGPY